jgi:hypothetical protein
LPSRASGRVRPRRDDRHPATLRAHRHDVHARADRLLASTTDGTLVVARANPRKYEEVRRYQIAPSALWAHPAITSSSIIVKDVDKVICWSF